MKPSIIFFYSANDYTGGYLEYLASEVDELKGIFMKIGEGYAYEGDMWRRMLKRG